MERKVEGYWKKDGTQIEKWGFKCSCGGWYRSVAYFSCVHEDFSSYLIQCKKCKDISQVERLEQNMIEDSEFLEAGWIFTPLQD